MMAAKAIVACAVGASGFGFYDGPAMTNFNRISTFPVCEQPGVGCDSENVTVAEIIAFDESTSTAVYSDSEMEAVGFVGLTDPSAPVGLGFVSVGGEPTSVAVAGEYALVAVNTSPDFVNVSGVLHAIDIATQTVVMSWELGGQPDSIAVSPDGAYAAIAIENERDEDLGDGVIPQMPAGYLVIVDLNGDTASWSTTVVDLVSLDGCFEASDPEPEYVSINSDNVAVVTLQENNCLAIVDLATATVTASFDAGSETLTQVDLVEDDVINMTQSTTLKREPDGVTWMGTEYFATANEGDMDGGGRSFTIYSTSGDVVYTSGNELEHIVASVGHYPEARSENKGAEPENVAYGVFDGTPYLFVNMERAGLVVVYDATDAAAPEYKQVLPSQVGPEGSVAVPSQGLLLVASEVDERENKIRSCVNVYARQSASAEYPTIVSVDRTDGTPIPFSALSGLGAGSGTIVYSVEDSFYGQSRIFVIETAAFPYQLVEEISITDADGVFASLEPYGDFEAEDLAALINDDGTVNIDPEGIAMASLGGEDRFVVASEGAGTIGDDSRPIESLNFIFLIDLEGVIKEVITLPDSVNDMQVRFGFEGVAVDDEVIYVAFQRAWGDEANPRIGMYDYASSTWSFVFYPLDAVESPFGGWVGLSDVAPLGSQQFLVLERDNQGGPDARVKRVYSVDLSGVADGGNVTKTLEEDLITVLESKGGLVFEKVEGLTVMESGVRFIVNDNDGVDDNSGEIQLLEF